MSTENFFSHYWLTLLNDFEIFKTDKCQNKESKRICEKANIFTCCTVLSLSLIRFCQKEMTKKEVKSSYRQSALKIHPDKNPIAPKLYNDAFIKLGQACTYLCQLIDEYEEQDESFFESWTQNEESDQEIQNKPKESSKRKRQDREKWNPRNFYKF